MLRGSSLCAWLYTLVLSLLNGVVGGGLVALCYNSFSTPAHEIGIVLRMCLVTGIVMVVFVFFWIIFIFCTWMASGQVTQECQSKKGEGTTSTSSSQATSFLGLLSLILLTISIMVDLSMTGLMWWTSQQLGDQYQVRGECFCERGTGHGQSGRGVRDIFDINCPMVEDFVCEAVFGAVKVTMHSVTVSTSDCQRLDGSQQDAVCLEYLTFWNLFKVLRIALPVLALVKLPVLLGNCSRWLCKERKQKSGQGKFATDSISWIGLDVLISPLKLVDPVQFYSDICTPGQPTTSV